MRQRSAMHFPREKLAGLFVSAVDTAAGRMRGPGPLSVPGASNESGHEFGKGLWEASGMHPKRPPPSLNEALGEHLRGKRGGLFVSAVITAAGRVRGPGPPSAPGASNESGHEFGKGLGGASGMSSMGPR